MRAERARRACAAGVGLARRARRDCLASRVSARATARARTTGGRAPWLKLHFAQFGDELLEQDLEALKGIRLCPAGGFVHVELSIELDLNRVPALFGSTVVGCGPSAAI